MAHLESGSAVPCKYEALASNDLRILRIEEYDVESEIRLSLRHCSRAQAPSYVAISYTWGDELASYEVTVNGKPFRVRPNLWHCLRHVTQEKEAKDSWRDLWIDAICIDQSNIVEKNEQVSKMHLTFQNAALCIAWLGLYPGMEMKYKPYEYQAAPEARLFLPDKLLKRELFLQPYFRRIWIVQELIASRKVLYLWGRRRIGWVDFVTALPTFLTQMDGNIFEARLLLNGWFSDVWRPLASLLLSKDKEGKNFSWRRPLRVMLSDVHKSSCSEPRDRVFGLLNILPTSERQILGTFFPDYSLSLERVQLITLAFLRSQNTLSGIWESPKLKSLLWILHIQSEDIQNELTSKTTLDIASDKGSGPRIFEYLLAPSHWIEDNYTVEPRNRDWIQKRIDALKPIASQSLSTESTAQAQYLREKAWFVHPEQPAVLPARCSSPALLIQGIKNTGRDLYKQTFVNRRPP